MVTVHVISIGLLRGEGDVNRCAAHFDGDNGVQNTDSGLEWF